MAFTGNEDHDFPLDKASEWTANYRSTIPTGETIAHYFGKTAIKNIFDQTDPTCVGMRIYYAIDEVGQKQLIIVGVDANGDDLYEGLLAERSIRCPQDCPAANPLNS